MRTSITVSAFLVLGIVAYFWTSRIDTISKPSTAFVLSSELETPYLECPLSEATQKTGEQTFTVGQVLKWADLNYALGENLDALQYGEADGQAILGNFVTLSNAMETVKFVRKHGYTRQSRLVRVRETSTSFYVDVEIEGEDGTTFRVLLESDGTEQGGG